tara:strand:+ start:631 stop:999 length:369 start_codon:yes stop_codon:yes gene_type:complete
MPKTSLDYVKEEKLLLLVGNTHEDGVQAAYLLDPLQVYTWCSPNRLIDADFLYFMVPNDDAEAEAALDRFYSGDGDGYRDGIGGIPVRKIMEHGEITQTDESSEDWESWKDCLEDFNANHRI